MNEIQHIQQSLIKIAKEQSKDEVLSEFISWVEKGQLPEMAETRGKAREVLLARSMFDPSVFKMKDGVLMNQVGELWRIYLPESMIREVWSLCQSERIGRNVE